MAKAQRGAEVRDNGKEEHAVATAWHGRVRQRDAGAKQSNKEWSKGTEQHSEVRSSIGTEAHGNAKRRWEKAWKRATRKRRGRALFSSAVEKRGKEMRGKA